MRPHRRENGVDQHADIHWLERGRDEFELLQKENVVDQPYEGIGVVRDCIKSLSVN